MLKKLMVGTLVTVLSTGIALGSVSAAENENEVEVNIIPGNLVLEMDETMLNFSAEIDHKLGAFAMDFDSEPLGYQVYDNRGVEDNYTVKHEFKPFTDPDPESDAVLTVSSIGDWEKSELSDDINPTLEGNTSLTVDAIDFSNLSFNMDDFVKGATYESVLTTTVETTGDPEED